MAMPSACKCAAGPSPERIRMAGEPNAPALSTTSRRAVKVKGWPARKACTVRARPSCRPTRSTVVSVKTCKLGRLRAGVRYALAALLHAIRNGEVPIRVKESIATEYVESSPVRAPDGRAFLVTVR